MSIRTRRWYHALLVGQFFTPRGFVVSAAQVSVLFLVMHLAGLRSCTTIFIGAAPAAGLAGRVAAGLGSAIPPVEAGDNPTAQRCLANHSRVFSHIVSVRTWPTSSSIR